jgi:flagellar protein FliO/FliZ
MPQDVGGVRLTGCLRSVVLGLALLIAIQVIHAAEPSGDGGRQPASTAVLTGKYENQLIRREAAPPSTQAAAPATAPSRPEGGMDLFRVVLSLAGVVVLVLVLRWVGRRYLSMPGGSGGSKVMKVVARSTLSPRQQLLMIQVGRRLVVAANSGGQVNTLCQITERPEVEEILAQLRMRGDSAGFGNVLGKAQQGMDEEKTDPSTGLEPVAGEEDIKAGLSGLTDKIRSMSKKFGE